MNSYIYSIGGAITVLALFENIAPNSKNGKLAKTIISIVCVTMIMSPIINIFKNDYSNSNIESNSDYNQYLLNYELNLTEKSIEYLLKNNDFTVENIDINGDNENGKYVIKSMRIKLANLVINENDEHIIISEKIKNLISSRLQIKDVEITIE